MGRRWVLGTALALGLLTALPVVAAGNRGLGLEIKDRAGDRVALYGESHALVIGGSDYTGGWPRLGGVKRDVPAVKTALENQGFRVSVVMDPDRDGLDRAFRSFISRHGNRPDNRLLFYFAGHGHSMKLGYGGMMGYLVGRDAPNPNIDKQGFKDRALSMQVIETYARNIESKHALFVFDSCFSGSIFDASRAIPDVIQAKTGKPVRQFITSGTADQTVPDKSIFRAQFVAALAGEGDLDGDRYVTGAELGQFLETTVTNYTRGAQTPQYGKLRDPLLDKGDFVFALKGAAKAPPPKPSAGANMEALFWQSIRSSTNGADFDAYLQQFPSGTFAALARNRLASLAPTPRPAPAPAPAKPAVGVFPDRRQPGKIFRDCSDCPEMVVIPSGSFRMGDLSGGGYKDEKPVRTVSIGDSFAVGKYEVTQAEYQAVMSTNPSGFKGTRNPVEKVSWNDAKEFTRKLSARTGKEYRLLSEAEWEYVARAGTTTKWSCGGSESCLEGAAWYGGNSGRQTHSVGSKSANRFDVHDMHGNVWEWVEDCYQGNYSGAPSDGSASATGDCKYRVNRGGGWYLNPGVLRSADRNRNFPDYRYVNLGFRVARTLP